MLLLYITVKDNDRGLSVPSIFLLYNHCSTTIILSYFLYLPLFLIFLCNILLYLVLRFQVRCTAYKLWFKHCGK